MKYLKVKYKNYCTTCNTPGFAITDDFGDLVISDDFKTLVFKEDGQTELIHVSEIEKC